MTDTANRDGQSPAKALDADTIRRVAEGKHADRSRLRRFLRDHRPAVGSFVVLVVMLACFFVGNPEVFSQWNMYRAVLIGLPVVLFVVVPLVYVVTVGDAQRLGLPGTLGLNMSIYSPSRGVTPAP